MKNVFGFKFVRNEDDCEVYESGHDWVAFLFHDNTLVVSGKGEDDYKKVKCESRSQALGILDNSPSHILCYL
ncbi:MAG: hypothetical protein IJV75_00365 [Alphaproteobacteria bacterium]|nr:hypothetical protein [Alphaproteobacteria bacterium]MBQ9737956.1 hypothetical protein [Alphaproteobacteria bacterium]